MTNNGEGALEVRFKSIGHLSTFHFPSWQIQYTMLDWLIFPFPPIVGFYNCLLVLIRLCHMPGKNSVYGAVAERSAEWWRIIARAPWMSISNRSVSRPPFHFPSSQIQWTVLIAFVPPFASIVGFSNCLLVLVGARNQRCVSKLDERGKLKKQRRRIGIKEEWITGWLLANFRLGSSFLIDSMSRKPVNTKQSQHGSNGQTVDRINWH